MATIGDFFDYIEEHGVADDACIYVSDYNGHMHEVGSLSSGDPDPSGGYPGHVTLVCDDVNMRWQRYCPADVYEFCHTDCAYDPDIPLMVELYAVGDKDTVEGFTVGDPPDGDYVYIVFC